MVRRGACFVFMSYYNIVDNKSELKGERANPVELGRYRNPFKLLALAVDLFEVDTDTHPTAIDAEFDGIGKANDLHDFSGDFCNSYHDDSPLVDLCFS